MASQDTPSDDLDSGGGAEPPAAYGDDPGADLHNDVDQIFNANLEEAVRDWRVAESLLQLRRQVNALAPGRGKANDGTIGDAAHASRASDHNPWVIDGAKGVVTAMDITHDPAGGCDSARLAETLRTGRDPRIKYLISNRRIASQAPKGGAPAWAWRAYAGANPHDHHCHISVEPDKAKYDSRADWAVAAAFGPGHEGVAAPAEESEGLDEIERALAALPAAAEAADAPLPARLIALQDAADGLLSAYSAAVHEPAGGDDIAEAPAPKFETLKSDYERLFAACTIPAARKGVVAWHRTMILRGRTRYQEAAARTGVPWWFIAIVHGLEASFNFRGHLHNGDPLSAKTVQVPRGRPPIWNPPSDWLSSAIDALEFEKFTHQADWSVARALYRWEAYNGWGYRGRAIATPYLWSFSNHYSKGKFVKDGKFDPEAVSKQCGAAVMLKALQNAGDATV